MSLLNLNWIGICNGKKLDALWRSVALWDVFLCLNIPQAASLFIPFITAMLMSGLWSSEFQKPSHTFLKSALCNWPFIKTLTEPQQQSSTLLSSGKLKGLYQVHTGVSLTSVCHKFISVYTQSQKQTKVITFKQRSLASSGVCESQEQ